MRHWRQRLLTEATVGVVKKVRAASKSAGPDCGTPGGDRITTSIERERLAEIIAGTKKIEYRQINPYWTKRSAKVSVPFELRPLNGMNPPVPEVTVLIHRITKDRRAGEYRLHIKRVLNYKHWDKRRQKPRR
jgi:hypothetical protein